MWIGVLEGKAELPGALPLPSAPGLPKVGQPLHHPPAGRDCAPSTERWWAGGISVLGSGSKTAYVNSCLDKAGLTAPLPTQVQLHFPACALKQIPQLYYT